MRTAFRSIFLVLFLLFFVIAIGGGLLWGNLSFLRSAPGGADFIVSWRAAQVFLIDGATPYGEWAATNIQAMIYGRTARWGEYPYLFSMPVHNLIFFIPFALIRDFSVSRAAWMTLLEILAVVQVFIALQLNKWKSPWLFALIMAFFGALSLPSITVLVSGSSILVQSALLFGALLAFENRADELGGAMIALSLVNVEAVGLVILLLLFWAVTSDRLRTLAGFFMALALLVGLGFLLFPGWLLPWIKAVFMNWQQNSLASTYTLFNQWLPGIGLRIGQLLAVAALSVLFFEWRAVRGKSVRWLFWTACLTFALTPMLGIRFSTPWLVFSIPGLVLAFSVMTERWGFFGQLLVAILLTGVFAGLWVGFQFPAVTILIYPIFLVLVLYWIRWGVVRPKRLWADEVARLG